LVNKHLNIIGTL